MLQHSRFITRQELWQAGIKQLYPIILSLHFYATELFLTIIYNDIIVLKPPNNSLYNI
jgi:hypothetical protein